MPLLSKIFYLDFQELYIPIHQLFKGPETTQLVEVQLDADGGSRLVAVTVFPIPLSKYESIVKDKEK